MGVELPSAGECAARWAKGMLRHGVETTRGPASMSNIRKVLWMVDCFLRTINRHSKDTACVTIPTVVLRDIGAERRDHVVWERIGPGMWMLCKASEQRVEAALEQFKLYDPAGRRQEAA